MFTQDLRPLFQDFFVTSDQVFFAFDAQGDVSKGFGFFVKDPSQSSSTKPIMKNMHKSINLDSISPKIGVKIQKKNLFVKPPPRTPPRWLLDN